MAEKKRPESDDDPPRRIIGTPTPEERQAAEDLIRASQTRHVIGAEDPSELTNDELRDELADLAPRLQASEVLGKDFRTVTERDTQEVVDDAQKFVRNELFDFDNLAPIDQMIIQQQQRDPSTHQNPAEIQHLEDIFDGKREHDDGSGSVRRPAEGAPGSGTSPDDDTGNRDDDHSGTGDGEHHSPTTGSGDDETDNTGQPADDDEPAEGKQDDPEPPEADPQDPNSPEDKVAPVTFGDTEGTVYYRPDGSMYEKLPDGTTKEDDRDDKYFDNTDDDDDDDTDDDDDDDDDDDTDELPPGDSDGDFHETGRARLEHLPNLTFEQPDDGATDPNNTDFGAGDITEATRRVPGVVDPVGPELEFGAGHGGPVPVEVDDGRTDPAQDDDTLGGLGPDDDPFDDHPDIEESADAQDDADSVTFRPPAFAHDIAIEDRDPDLAIHDLD